MYESSLSRDKHILKKTPILWYNNYDEIENEFYCLILKT